MFNTSTLSWSAQPLLTTQTSTGTGVTFRQAAQYASRACQKLAVGLKATVFMNRCANAWHNAPMEGFFKTLKVERIHQVHYKTRAQARLDIVDWIEGYHNR